MCGKTTGNVKGWIGNLYCMEVSYRFNRHNTVAYVPITPVSGMRQLTIELNATMRNGCHVYRWDVYYLTNLNSSNWQYMGPIQMPKGEGYAKVDWALNRPTDVAAMLVVPNINGSYTYGLNVTFSNVQGS